MSITRKEFIRLGTAGLGTAAAGLGTAAAGLNLSGLNPHKQVESSQVGASSSPLKSALAIGSINALRGVELAYSMMMNNAADPLDSAIEGVKIQELDPSDNSVGYGGLPNENGVVQLDASCMHGPTNRAGSVGCLEGIKTPSLVAKAVMEYTSHIMLVGEGAKNFALSLGFKEEELLTEESRKAWLRWKSRHSSKDNWLEQQGDHRVDWTTGTVHISAITSEGDIGSITSTSGLSWKIPGRVGDSPIIGAGQYCDNAVGSAGSTGLGEANIKVCGTFLTVEFMRQGMSPEEACLQTLKRVVERTEKRLLDDKGRPTFGLEFYALNKKGEFGGAKMFKPSKQSLDNGGGRFAVADHKGARGEKMAWLYE